MKVFVSGIVKKELPKGRDFSLLSTIHFIFSCGKHPHTSYHTHIEIFLLRREKFSPSRKVNDATVIGVLLLTFHYFKI